MPGVGCVKGWVLDHFASLTSPSVSLEISSLKTTPLPVLIFPSNSIQLALVGLERRSQTSLPTINIGVLTPHSSGKKGCMCPQKRNKEFVGILLSVQVRIACMCDPACGLVSEYLSGPYVELVCPSMCICVFLGLSVCAWEVIFWSLRLYGCCSLCLEYSSPHSTMALSFQSVKIYLPFPYHSIPLIPCLSFLWLLQ